MAALERVFPHGGRRPALTTGIDGIDAQIDWLIFGQQLALDVEVTLLPQQSREAVRKIIQANPPARNARPLLAAPFMSPAAREELEEAGWCYWDATGNLLIQSERPAVWVRELGDQREPGPNTKARREKLRSLKGPAASELIVYLLIQGRAASVRELSRATGVSVATTSRVVGTRTRSGGSC